MAPQSDPEVIQMDMGKPSKHIVFIVWATEWATWGGFGNQTFLRLLPRSVFLKGLDSILRFGSRKNLKNGVGFRGQVHPETKNMRQKDKITPMGVKMEPPAAPLHQNATQK